MANPIAITLHAYTSEIESGVGSSVDLGLIAEGATAFRTAARLELVVGSTSDALTVSIETSFDGAIWLPAGTFPAVNASPGTAKIELALVDLLRFVRARWTFFSAPAPAVANFSVIGNAHQVFLSKSDLTSGAINDRALQNVPEHVIADAIIKTSTTIEDHLNSAYKLPVTAAGDSVRQYGAQIAAWLAVSHRGVSVDGADEVLERAAKSAESWLFRVSQGKLKPPGIVDSTTSTFEGGAVVASQASRGW